MGLTGSGKSNFINKLTGSKEESRANGLKSCTQDIREFIVDLPVGKRYMFVDTPGFDNTYRSDRDILRTIADWLGAKYRAGLKLTGVIYTHRISDNCTTRQACKSLDLFSQLCGDEAAQCIRLVTTMWDNQKPENAAIWQRRVSQLEGNLWNPLISLGARHEPFFNTQESAWNIVNGLVQAHWELGKASAGHALLIQEEMVDAQKTLNETSAGRMFYPQLQNVLSGQKGMLKDLADALAEKDLNVAEQLRAEYRKAEAERRREIEDMERMKIPLGRQIAVFFGGRKTHSRKIELNFTPGDLDYRSCGITEDDHVILYVAAYFLIH
ncbi:P-loop containing nucleoside triphosphate hydrolase protein [Pisolithus marmoratus]|nr:P-loop containing nucleoside triphosphate hydrolase protein [Pisolithus marmoratus]